MLDFTENGYLEPFGEIETTIEVVKEHFIWNNARIELFISFETFISELQSIIQQPFTVWLNGSFTTKKELPNDIDCVIFIDFESCDKNQKAIFDLKRAFKKLKIDNYFVKVYPTGHKLHFLYELNRQEWFYNFHKTNPNKAKQKYFKGFLHIKF